ncbi:MAG: hypothetical protein ACFB8W_17975 [Elainellaceae cyanobacterium]
MNPHHHELRQAAAEAFQQSLDQLEQHLAPLDAETSSPAAVAGSSPSETTQPPPEQHGPSEQIDAIAFADAAADIEQFIRSQT